MGVKQVAVMCLAMNPERTETRDIRCASTSNRSFEGRQGAWRTYASRISCNGKQPAADQRTFY